MNTLKLKYTSMSFGKDETICTSIDKINLEILLT